MFIFACFHDEGNLLVNLHYISDNLLKRTKKLNYITRSKRSMALIYPIFFMSIGLLCLVNKVHLVSGKENEIKTCEDLQCEPGQSCYLEEIKCSRPPCPRQPSCQTSTIPLVTCELNSTCDGSKALSSCEGYHCGPGQECYMRRKECQHPPCPQTPSCRGSCHVVRCSSGYVCKDGHCIVDGCATILCAEGSNCLNGKCVLANPTCHGVMCKPGERCYLEAADCVNPPCSMVAICRPSCDLVNCTTGYICKNGKCVFDNCAIVRCQGGFKCVDGKCIKGKVSCDGIMCGPGEECYINKTTPFNDPVCRPVLTCTTINCLRGYVCKDNKCIPEPTCEGIQCPPGEVCRLKRNNCIQPPCLPTPRCEPALTCATILCQDGFQCINNKCIQTPTCKGVKCGPAEECFLDKVEDCVKDLCPLIPTCRPVDRCALIRCHSGYQCFNGSCVKAPTCKEHHCNSGEVCYLEEVQCFTAPCFPIPSCKPLMA